MSNRGRHKKSFQHLIVQILGQKIADRIMRCQREQGNLPNLDVFLLRPTAGHNQKGFTWCETKEGHDFWEELLNNFQNHYLYKKWKNGRC